jgi:hypothetical protein
MYTVCVYPSYRVRLREAVFACICALETTTATRTFT